MFLIDTNNHRCLFEQGVIGQKGQSWSLKAKLLLKRAENKMAIKSIIDQSFSTMIKSVYGTAIPSQHRASTPTVYSRIQRQVYELLYAPTGALSYVYHLLVFVLVLLCLVLTVLVTVPRFETTCWPIMAAIEWVIVVWFGIEFLIRLWANGYRRQYRGFRGRVLYLLWWQTIMDCAVLAVSVGVLFTPRSAQNAHVVYAAAALRGIHRFFQVIRIVSAQRRGLYGVASGQRPFRPFNLFWSVIKSQGKELVIICYICCIVFVLSAYLIFVTESPDNPDFATIGQSMYWALEAMYTLGNYAPITLPGKIVASLVITFGVWLFAIPADIIGTGLAIKIRQNEIDYRTRAQLVPAVQLIQAYWRYRHYSVHPPTIQPTVSWFTAGDRVIADRMERNVVRFVRRLRLFRAVRVFSATRLKVNMRDLCERNRSQNVVTLTTINSLRSEVKDRKVRHASTVTTLMDRMANIEAANREMTHRFDLLENLLNNHLKH
ncbi:unnamed protein product [Medioppia subpectinata]|uniref:Ion transport domain-containing protein n=1 Tax=Medioppia subpectinata TaxID=1979941 RepID=A0A7R9PZC0_9ACAR|nr:unnamed protein product [Medioppia subpectinata]CAG2106819.1 unnamed protein product [Medioppia subpectinata]